MCAQWFFSCIWQSIGCFLPHTHQKQDLPLCLHLVAYCVLRSFMKFCMWKIPSIFYLSSPALVRHSKVFDLSYFCEKQLSPHHSDLFILLWNWYFHICLFTFLPKQCLVVLFLVSLKTSKVLNHFTCLSNCLLCFSDILSKGYTWNLKYFISLLI